MSDDESMTSVDMCHNGHPFEPGVDTDMEADGRTPSPEWCNVCGEGRADGHAEAERKFWAAFEYDNDAERWMLAKGMSPMDVLEVSRQKLAADAEYVARLVAAVDACEVTR